MSVMRHLNGVLADDPNITSQNQLMFWSVFTLAFFAFLRSNKFTSPFSIYSNPMVHLSHSDISFTSKESLSLQLTSSKTDYLQIGCSIMFVCSMAMHHYLAHRPPCNSNPLILSQQGNFLNFVPPSPGLGFHHRVLYAPHSFHIVGSNYCHRG